MSFLRFAPSSRSFALAAVSAVLLAGCSDDSQKQAAPAAPPPSVTVAKVAKQDIRQSARLSARLPPSTRLIWLPASAASLRKRRFRTARS